MTNEQMESEIKYLRKVFKIQSDRIDSIWNLVDAVRDELKITSEFTKSVLSLNKAEVEVINRHDREIKSLTEALKITQDIAQAQAAMNAELLKVMTGHGIDVSHLKVVR